MSLPSTLQYSSFSTIFQQIVPTELLGRFYSVRSIIKGLVGIIFLMVGGYVTDIAGPLLVLFISGIGAILMAIPIKKVLVSIMKEQTL
jgi:hypothetical protein